PANACRWWLRGIRPPCCYARKARPMSGKTSTWPGPSRATDRRWHVHVARVMPTKVVPAVLAGRASDGCRLLLPVRVKFANAAQCPAVAVLPNFVWQAGVTRVITAVPRHDQ